ncbi:hypothetical protein SPOG_05265 [Schizosaccharomyces cryophilus OY26]|uniref:Uncharacterized protein n=1 Tax=Schizosaccharomyces cryophilus (strain OY26 / ATCC MYA-4695 / CBS 11777 / NBRC 106824 / NRRL Y48691) TaxID=653667 RepID=S9XER2_SCHCR|nr:uncharacterized protein SPOG_05265 [Schizosaccharomyces cryophilus OY26]EPY52271.1 hypothetical protein SPOG_05265 [Schizosaccharomyces cryophilus OY26]
MSSKTLEEYIDLHGESNLDKLVWSSNAINKYRQKASYFNELLYCLVCISAGQPVRAEEKSLWSLRDLTKITNKINFLFGRIMICTRHNKACNMKYAKQPIVIFLPESLSILALRYYALVRPFEYFLKYLMSGRDETFFPYRDVMFVVRGQRTRGRLPQQLFSRVVYKDIQRPMGLRNYYLISNYFREKLLDHKKDPKNSCVNVENGCMRSSNLQAEKNTDDTFNYLPHEFFINSLRESLRWHELLQIKNNDSYGPLHEPETD